MIDLSGKVALVTGSSRGIGRACALRLAEAGADVVVNYVTSSNEAELVAEQIAAMGRNVACVRADVSHEDDVEEMLQFVSEKFGRLDILVHNAATGGFRPLSVTTQRHFDAAMHTNVMSLVHLLKAASPMLQQSAAAGGRQLFFRVMERTWHCLCTESLVVQRQRSPHLLGTGRWNLVTLE